MRFSLTIFHVTFWGWGPLLLLREWGFKCFLVEGIRIGEKTVTGLQIDGHSHNVCTQHVITQNTGA